MTTWHVGQGVAGVRATAAPGAGISIEASTVGKFGFSFSWKRALGLSAAKARLSRKIGIPLTRSGRQRKIGRMMTGGGCLLLFAAGLVAAAVLVGGLALAAALLR